MTLSVYELQEHIRPIGKIFKCQHLNLHNSQLMKAQSQSEVHQPCKCQSLQCHMKK